MATWLNYSFASENPRGNDFQVYLTGTKNFLIKGISPYGEESTALIQKEIYGNAETAGKHQYQFGSPLYIVFLFIPLSLLRDPILARAIWMTILEIAIMASIYLSIRLAGWRPKPIILLFFFIFSLTWFHTIKPVVDGNEVILALLFLLIGFSVMDGGSDEVAGLFFALTTIKPGVFLVCIAFVILWAIICRRWQIVLWYFGSLILLSGFAALLIPNWILQNLVGVVRGWKMNFPSTAGDALTLWFPAMGERIGWILAAVMSGILLIAWFRSWNAEHRLFLWTCYLSLAIGQMVGIPTQPGNFIALLPGLAIIFTIWEERWRKFGTILVIIGMLGLSGGTWLVVFKDGGPLLQALNILTPILFFPAPFFEVVMLLWVRWWVEKPPSTWFDMVYSKENRL